ncbi:MAG: RNase adapter RapZ [Clostridiales bacterium]
MKLIIITGLSGAGKSLTTNYLEDLGYFCVDNLPSSLIPKFTEICIKAKGKMDKIAMVVDIRGEDFLKDLFPALDELKYKEITYEILFLDANDDVLIKRFKEARRNHPLAPDGRIIDGIKKERVKLKDLRENSNNIINTSKFTPRMLRDRIHNIFLNGKKEEFLSITILSFGFKYGIPIDSDLVFDVRFISNPYYIEEMRYQTGLDNDVKKFVMGKDETKEFVNKTFELLNFLILNYIKEGKSQLIISIGCTGGRHRSVAISHELYKMLGKNNSINIEHRDIEKDHKKK